MDTINDAASRMLEEALNESVRELGSEVSTPAVPESTGIADRSNLPPNTFVDPNGIVPVGTPEQLEDVRLSIISGDAGAICINTSNPNVFKMEITEVPSDRILAEYWVSRLWRDRLMDAMPHDSGASRESHGNSSGHIPENSSTILTSDVGSRFSGALWFDKIKNQEVILAGVGGIGSHLGFLLSRFQVKRIFLYDTDAVDESNMSGQLYSRADIRRYKVDALSTIMESYSDFYSVVANRKMFTSSCASCNIMMCGFDNMEARKVFYNVWRDRVRYSPVKSQCLFIDGRLAAEEFQVFSIQGNDERAMKEYESRWLFDDSEAEETLCSYKQTTYMATMIASVMANVFVNFVTNMCHPVVERDVPFMISYDGTTMFTKTEM